MNQHRFFFRLCPILFFLFLSHAGIAQDTLPSFSAEIKAKNKILVSWTNPYGTKIKQLSIQRSRDSTKLFKTIISIPDPTVLKNGFLDQNLPDTNFYYRIYIMLDGGEYSFSLSKMAKSIPAAPKPRLLVQQPKPPVETAPVKKPEPVPDEKPRIPQPEPEKYLIIKRGDEIVGELNDRFIQRFRDSISMKTKDTITMSSRDTIVIRPFRPKEVFGLSRYIFIDKAGLIHVELPWYARRKYLVKFFEEDLSPLFEIKEIRDATLLLDKANFMKAGWYYFEIFEDGKLLEKNRVFVSRDF